MNGPEPVAPTNPVGAGEATAGTFIAGLVSYVTIWTANKYHLPAELVGGAMTLVASGAMALWHQLKS